MPFEQKKVTFRCGRGARRGAVRCHTHDIHKRTDRLLRVDGAPMDRRHSVCALDFAACMGGLDKQHHHSRGRRRPWRLITCFPHCWPFPARLPSTRYTLRPSNADGRPPDPSHRRPLETHFTSRPLAFLSFYRDARVSRNGRRRPRSHSARTLLASVGPASWLPSVALARARAWVIF